jgi:hypothetical protein
MALDIRSLSEELFWDVQREMVDPVVHRRWLVERVLERGRWQDWLAVSEDLGTGELERLAHVLKVSPKSRHFLAVWTMTHAAS